ncbi:MAG: prepilin-type N-terminal cleavage/methylation domain-containing protein [Bacillota bacterium]|nr:prepilin-type N-terminal cleavage/methylation domain-containing protein [Bacillota bacterium]MDW7678558.1 prepilin-type N-terminal cleavage/methylation domain-containing protein [Bacillota bacterium]
MIIRKNNKGMTLVEIIIALAILGIIAVSFLGMFTSAIYTVFAMGNHSRAIAEAQMVLDRIYEDADIIQRNDLEAHILSILDDFNYSENDPDDPEFYINSQGNELRYEIVNDSLLEQGTIQIVKLTLTYQNNERTVRLSTPLPKLQLPDED